ncbi:hypothetical protein M0811_14305 [Anaeramoeba ignava]|uniref:Uncharacterized protein n=1 Tax=Anaeramoeba ignava TaxID=1746090 RepID=A0A9Q0LWD4_ANAIG|nr:hypothetical protein M0811_14305 [Anaeramoeba ignava]
MILNFRKRKRKRKIVSSSSSPSSSPSCHHTSARDNFSTTGYWFHSPKCFRQPLILENLRQSFEPVLLDRFCSKFKCGFNFAM